MGIKSKRKGDNFERRVVNTFRKVGFEAERTLDQVRYGTGGAPDVTVKTPGGKSIKIECKHHATFTGRKLWEWIPGHDILVVKVTNYEPPLVVLSLEDYIKLIGG